MTVRIDKTSPTITHQLVPGAERQRLEQLRRDGHLHLRRPGRAVRDRSAAPRPRRWTPRAATSRSPAPRTDNAGNSATDPAKVSLDKTKPTITGSRTPEANGYGWNNSDVTVHFAASDSLSGIDLVTAGQDAR